MSRRIAIRNAFKAAILGKTDAGARVYSNISSTIWREEMPQIVVYTRGETIEKSGTAPVEYKRSLELVVEIIAEGSEGPRDSSQGPYVEDVVDLIASQVEAEISRDDSLGDYTAPDGQVCKLVDSLELQTVALRFEAESNKPTASAALVFNAVYHEFLPSSIEEQGGLGNLESVHADWKVGHHDDAPDNVVEAQDILTLPD